MKIKITDSLGIVTVSGELPLEAMDDFRKWLQNVGGQRLNFFAVHTEGGETVIFGISNIVRIEAAS